jgi:sugar phosphate isomerase/epimerase
MEIGISSLHLIGKPFRSLLDSIGRHEVRLWEIVDENSLRLDNERVQSLLELREEHNLRFTMHAPFTDVNIASLVPEVRQMSIKRLEQSMRYASQLNVEAWVVHPGQRGALTSFYPSEEWRLNVEAIAKLAASAKSIGVQMCLENMPKWYSALMNDCESFNRIHDELGSTELKMVLDIGHANTSGEVTAFLDKFHDRIIHAHAHDNQGKSDSHDEIGKGTVNWPAVAQKLRGSACRTIVVESTKGVESSLERLQQLLG